MTDKTVEPDNYTPEEREAMGWPKPQTVEQEIDGILGGFMLDWVEAVEKAKGDKKAETRYMREAVKIRTEQLLTLLTASNRELLGRLKGESEQLVLVHADGARESQGTFISMTAIEAELTKLKGQDNG